MLFLVVLLREITPCEGDETMLGNILADAKSRKDRATPQGFNQHILNNECCCLSQSYGPTALGSL